MLLAYFAPQQSADVEMCWPFFRRRGAGLGLIRKAARFDHLAIPFDEAECLQAALQTNFQRRGQGIEVANFLKCGRNCGGTIWVPLNNGERPGEVLGILRTPLLRLIEGF